ncbi:MAG: putative CRISPR-associated protein [Candidatus Nezhaarchaeales archaeon]
MEGHEGACSSGTCRYITFKELRIRNASETSRQVQRRGDLAMAQHTSGDERQKYIESITRGHEIFEGMLEYVNSKPKESCAELNAFYSFLDHRIAWKNVSEIYLYATDTASCMLCARVIYEHLRSEKSGLRPGVKVQEPIRVKHWGVGYFEEGLKSLMDLLAGIIKSKKEQGYRVFVNATAGFKPEAVFATITSALLKADGVYYIHEAHRNLIYMPLLPLTIERKYVRALRKLGYWIPKKAAEELLRIEGLSLMDLEDMGLLEEKDGKVKVRKWVKALLSRKVLA